MTIQFIREIDQLKRKILSLSANVEEALAEAVKAFLERDPKRAQRIIDEDKIIDQLEVETEEECLKILALHQPVAIDLRFVIAVLKMNNDLERIADQAANIAERAIFLSNQPPVNLPDSLSDMAQRVKAMLHRCLDALVNMDAEAARETIDMDDQIDALHRDNFKTMSERLTLDPERTDIHVSMISVSRQLERIGDQVENIAEDIIYMVEGEIVRHGVLHSQENHSTK